MQFPIAISAAAVVGLFALPSGMATAGSLADAIAKNHYQPLLPPTTEGRAGSLYIKMKSETGDVVRMPVCDLFPNAKTAKSSDANSPVASSVEVWDSIDTQKTAGFRFLFSLTKAIKAVTGVEIGAGWQRVKKADIDWGPISSTTLVMLDLKQASAASQGVGTYRGAYDGACFKEARDLLANKRDAYVIARMAQASSLKAKVELNPAADKKAETATKTEKVDAAAAPAAKAADGIETAAKGAVTKVVQAAGDAGAAAVKGGAEGKDAVGKKDATAKTDAATPAPGANVTGSVDLLELFKIKASAGISQTGTSELQFSKPMNVGYVPLTLKALRRVGAMTGPQYVLTFDALTPGQLDSADGAVSEDEYEAIRRRHGG